MLRYYILRAKKKIYKMLKVNFTCNSSVKRAKFGDLKVRFNITFTGFFVLLFICPITSLEKLIIFQDTLYKATFARKASWIFEYGQENFKLV